MTARAATVAALAGLLLAIALVGPAANPARAPPPPPESSFTIWATTVNGVQQFEPTTISIGAQLPHVLHITVDNVDPTAGMQHTFTIRSTTAAAFLVDTGLLTPGQTHTLDFTVVAANQIVSGARNETVETDATGIKFFCQPHEGAGMIGHIVIGGGASTPVPEEKGVFLRAYWIGLLGIAGTLLLVAISYFVIKSSSRHYRDHHEHIRRGGP